MARHKRLPAEPFEVTIDSLLENGRGLAVHEAKRLEVHDALPGERLLVRHLFGRRFRGQVARVKSLLPSPDRVPARCAHFGTCSACTLQHMEPRAQLGFRQQIMLRYLREAGGLEPEQVLPPLASDQWQYRRKARLSVRYVEGKGRVLVGFRERDGRYVTDMQACHILAGPVATHIQSLIHLLAQLEGARTIPQIEVSCGDEACALIFRHLEPLSEADLARLRDFAGSTGLAVLLQAEGPDSLQALEPAERDLRYRLPEFDLEFLFQALDFVQVNGSLNRAMVSQAVASAILRCRWRSAVPGSRASKGTPAWSGARSAMQRTTALPTRSSARPTCMPVTAAGPGRGGAFARCCSTRRDPGPNRCWARSRTPARCGWSMFPAIRPRWRMMPESWCVSTASGCRRRA